MPLIWRCCLNPPAYIYYKAKGWRTLYCEKHFQLMKDKFDPEKIRKLKEVNMNEGAKNILRLAGLGDKVELVEKGFCPTCKRKVDANKFRDEKSRKEFEISGMCQNCQDEVFKKEE